MDLTPVSIKTTKEEPSPAEKKKIFSQSLALTKEINRCLSLAFEGTSELKWFYDSIVANRGDQLIDGRLLCDLHLTHTDPPGARGVFVKTREQVDQMNKIASRATSPYTRFIPFMKGVPSQSRYDFVDYRRASFQEFEADLPNRIKKGGKVVIRIQPPTDDSELDQLNTTLLNMKKRFAKIYLFPNFTLCGVDAGTPPSTPSSPPSHIDFSEFPNQTKQLTAWFKSFKGTDGTDFCKFVQETIINIKKKYASDELDALDQNLVTTGLKYLEKFYWELGFRINAGVSGAEGTFLFKSVIDLNAKTVCEVGMANGLSASYLLVGLEKVKKDGRLLFSIDPFQDVQWKNRGMEAVKMTGLQKHHRLLKVKSYEGLPSLLEKWEEQIDLVFVDGWHTFDFTLVDVFYADRLLRKGGYLLLDDVKHENVKGVMNYINTNWRHYRPLRNHPSTMAGWVKIGDDSRDWNFHQGFKV
jgi:predicted O-methyltransferase YrrM